MHERQLSYYEILKLSPDASDMDVKRAYRQLAMFYHPDHNPQNKLGSEQKFQMVCEAYKHLKTKEKRRAYNQKLYAQNDNAGPQPWLLQLSKILTASPLSLGSKK